MRRISSAGNGIPNRKNEDVPDCGYDTGDGDRYAGQLVLGKLYFAILVIEYGHNKTVFLCSSMARQFFKSQETPMI